jgi:hypothetical protein
MNDPWLSNIKPVDAATEKWALAQHFLMVADGYGENHISTASKEGREAVLTAGRVASLEAARRNFAKKTDLDRVVRNQRIRCLYAAGVEIPALMERFGVGRTHIRTILNLRPEAG